MNNLNTIFHCVRKSIGGSLKHAFNAIKICVTLPRSGYVIVEKITSREHIPLNGYGNKWNYCF